MMDRVTSARERLRRVFFLRGMLLVAVGGLLIDAGIEASGIGALLLILAFAFSNVTLLSVPRRLVGSTTFDHVIGSVDLVLVGLGVYLAGAGATALPISCLLMVLVVALGGHKPHTVAAGVAVGAIHAWLMLREGPLTGIASQLTLQTLFICAVGLYYACLTEHLHRRRARQSAQSLERQELGALLEILTAVTSTLDRREVAQSIVKHLASVVPAMRCSLLYVNREGTRSLVLASHDDPRVHELEIDLGRYPEIREAIRTHEPVIIQDAFHHPLMAGVRDYFQHLDFHSIAVIPLTFASDVLGTLCLKTARSSDEFDTGEIKFITAVARVSANAMKNAMLYQQVSDESIRHRSTSEKLSSILNHDPNLILTTDLEGRITEFNSGAEQLLGYTRLEVLGRHCGILGPDASAALLARVQKSGVEPSHACRLTRKDGALLEIELHVALLEKDRGTVWIGHDVTELKSTQLQLIQAEKLSSIGEVISGVAHELNNPLSGVLGFSQLLMARHGDGPLVRELERINDSAQRCQKIVKNLLSFSRVHEPERKQLGVNGIIEKTLDLKKYQLHVNNIEVVKDLDPELPLTLLDFHQMQQVLLNLINNAQHAISIVDNREGKLTVRTFRHDDSIRIEVTDNGRGMTEEQMPKIFDPFYTTKAPGEGTGLGLSVSYGIVRDHGGRILVRSQAGQGSTFTIELPILKGQETQPSAEPQRLAVDDGTIGQSTGRILIVDDEPTILDLLYDILEEQGHRVDTAGNGEEACRKFGASRYDMVITDVRMPQMNGIELYQRLIDTRPELRRKVVFITGDLIDSEISRFLGEVRAPTLPKPLEISHVVEIVRQTLNGPGPGGET